MFPQVFVCSQGGLHNAMGQADPPLLADRDTVNKRAVRILLECILLYDTEFGSQSSRQTNNRILNTRYGRIRNFPEM